MRGAHVALLGLLIALAAPAAASAHAVLEETSPPRGGTVDAAPRAVEFRFNERVEAQFGAVRVYDASGERVDDGQLLRPSPDGTAVGVGVPGLRDGTYTATFRVVSSDSHPVSGGFVFTVGEGGAAPAASVSELIEEGEASRATATAFGVVRGIGYAAIAIAIGAVVFLLWVWRPAPAAAAGGEDAWPRTDDVLVRRLLVVGAGGALIGALTADLSLIFQGAIATGRSLPDAAAPAVVGDVLSIRFGEVTGIRMALLLVTGVGALALLRRGRACAPTVGLLAAALVAAATTFGLGGHAGSTEPTWLMVPADAVHVVAMGAWVGGLAMLLWVLPAATRRLDPSDRTRLLAAVLGRFSPLAVACVALLATTGTAQSVVHLSAFADLVETAFGRAVLIKIGLFGLLVGLGAYNQRRPAPRLRELAATGSAPGAAGHLLRNSIRAEVALAVVAIGVTAALVSYSPSSAGSNLLAESRDLGPARMELTLEPLRAGPQELHVYLFDRRTGAAFDRIDEFHVTAALPSEDVGPIEVEMRKAGPGHYTTSAAPISPAGDWTLRAKLRTGRFDVHNAKVEARVR